MASVLVGMAWSARLFLTSIEKPELRTETASFRFALVYPAIYMVPFVLVLVAGLPVSGAIIVPLHLLCMLCLLYDLRFVSKSLALAERGKPASFYDYAGPFFLIWFFPIGVWFVQPRINRFYAEQQNS